MKAAVQLYRQLPLAISSNLQRTLSTRYSLRVTQKQFPNRSYLVKVFMSVGSSMYVALLVVHVVAMLWK